MVQLADKPAEKKAAVEQNKQDKKAVHDAGPSKSAAEKSEAKRSDHLAEAFPGSQPDPGPEPRPPLELSDEQKKEEEEVREIQTKALDSLNVPGHNVLEVLGHSAGKSKKADDDVRAVTFLNLRGEVIMHVDKAGDIHFSREEFNQLQRVVGTLAGTL